MNKHLRKSVVNFLKRASSAGVKGKKANLAEISKVNEQLGDIIPPWFVNLITEFSICGIVFYWQEFPPEDDFDGLSSLMWSRPNDIWEEMHELYPGIHLLELGFFNVACDDDGMGDPYYINSNESDNPPIYHVCHDLLKDAELQIGNYSAAVASNKLSDFFKNAIFK